MKITIRRNNADADKTDELTFITSSQQGLKLIFEEYYSQINELSDKTRKTQAVLLSRASQK